MRASNLSLITAACLCGAAIRAQVPADWGALSSFERPSFAAGVQGGVGVFDPRRLNVLFPIQGLPADLTGKGTQQSIGANAVLVRSSDGALVVGETAPVTQPSTDIWLLELNGLTVKRSSRYSIGTPSNQGMIDQMAWLPDGRVVFSYRNVQSPSLPRMGVAILDLVSGKVASIATTLPTGRWTNALAVSRDGSTVYLAMGWQQSQAYFSDIYAIPVRGGPAVSCAKITGSTQQLCLDIDGKLLVGIGDGNLAKVDTATKRVTVLPAGLPGLNAVEVDRLTGDYLVYGQSNGVRGIYRVGPKLQTTPVVTSFPKTGLLSACGLGAMSGIAQRHAVMPYGPSFAGKNRFDWSVHPGPLPRVGNAAFQLGLVGSSKGLTGVVLLAAASNNLQTPFPFRLLLTPPLILAGGVVGTPKAVLPLPIPPIPALRGQQVCAQTVYLDGNSLYATEGLRILIH